jgi:hypothetical protein
MESRGKNDRGDVRAAIQQSRPLRESTGKTDTIGLRRAFMGWRLIGLQTILHKWFVVIFVR